MPTTTIQKDEAIKKGSVRVLIGDDFDSLVDVGALRNPVMTSLVENQNIEFDNVTEMKKFVKGKRVQFTFDLAEINLTHLATLDSGLVTLETTEGSEVTGEEQVVNSGDWGYNNFIKLENQNGDGSQPNVNSVSGGTDGELTADTDYYVGKDSQGNWGIFVVDSTDVTTESQSITINYDYTPNASKKLTFGSSGTKVRKVMRVVNIDENEKEFRIDIEEGTNFTPYALDFAGDDEEDVAVLPIQFEGEVKEIVDEQQTS